MKALHFLVCACLLLVLAGGVYGQGLYQRTKPGKGVTKSLVWNDDPAPGDSFTWSGKNDKDGYATGEGTLTWYTRKQIFRTGANLPFTRLAVVGHYSGKMVRGKLDGPVTKVDENGETFHGKFVDGKKAGEWASGPLPAANRTEVAVEKPRNEPAPTPPPATIEAPAEGPPAATKTEKIQPPTSTPETIREQTTPRSTDEGPSVITNPPADQTAAKPAATEAPSPAVVSSPSAPEAKTKYDDSLRQLIGPPTKLRGRDQAPVVAAPTAAAAARPRLTQAEAIELANSEARSLGHDLGLYQRPQAQYNPADGTWSVSYAERSAESAIEPGRVLVVSVEDKTKKTSIKN